MVRVKAILKENGYPIPIIEREVKKTLHLNPPIFGPELKPIFICVPWLGASSSALKNKLQQATRKAIHWCRVICSFTSRTAFNLCRKDILPTASQSNIVYLFKCSCSCTYVGRTVQRLEERIGQHVPRGLIGDDGGSLAVKRRGRPRKNNNLTEVSKTDTAITRHLKESALCLQGVARKTSNHFSILAKGRSLLQLQFLEALYIKSNQPSLCVQKEHVKSLALF